MLLELESEGGGITRWRKEGRASHRRHPSRLGCGGGNEQDREEQSVVPVMKQETYTGAGLFRALSAVLRSFCFMLRARGSL